jgi:hypothetical protein
MKRFLILVVLAMILGPIWGSTQAHAAFIFEVIDDFKVSQPFLSKGGSDGFATSVATGAASQIAGTERESKVERIGSGTVTLDIDGSGVMSASIPNNNTGFVELKYDGVGSAGLGLDFNLYGVPLNKLFFSTEYEVSANQPLMYTVELYTDGGNWSTTTQSLAQTPLNTTLTLKVPLTSFGVGAGAGVDLSNVNSIVLRGTFAPATAGGSFSYQTPFVLTAIPEPASLTLFGIASCLGLGGVVMRRRRAARQRS